MFYDDKMATSKYAHKNPQIDKHSSKKYVRVALVTEKTSIFWLLCTKKSGNVTKSFPWVSPFDTLKEQRGKE